MEAGAPGITTALIYPPAFFAKTDELIELCKVAAKYKGKYTAHIRSEANQLNEAVQETIRISREAGIPAEIYHLKAAGEPNWPKMDQVIKMIEDARRQGLKVTADMYTYPAGAVANLCNRRIHRLAARWNSASAYCLELPVHVDRSGSACGNSKGMI